MKRTNIGIRTAHHLQPLVFGLVFAVLVFSYANAQETKFPSKNIVHPEKIRSAVKAYIEKHAPWDSGQMVIKRIRFDQPINLPYGPITIRIIEPKHTDWLGAVPFSVQFIINGRSVRRVTVPANIEVWSDVILTTRPLGKFEPIGNDDILVKKMNLARIPSDVIVSIDEIVGRRAKRNIAANCVVRRDQVEIPPIIKRGDMVQVIADSPSLKISVKGIAKQDGAKGDRIKVINIRSKRAIYAQVIDSQTVSVDF